MTNMLAAAEKPGRPEGAAAADDGCGPRYPEGGVLGALEAPAGAPEALTEKVSKAVEGLTDGANLLKEAITKLDPAIGAQSAETLDAAERILDEVRADLEARPNQ